MVWPEVQAISDAPNRCNLVLSGPDIAKKIEDDGLDGSIFKLRKLNFLEISKARLKMLPVVAGDLVNLTTLSLQCNELESIPQNLERLTSLKHLDLSRNRITVLANVFRKMEQVKTLNLSSNLLEQLPDLSGMTWLALLDISHNKFREFPECLTLIDGKVMEHLAEVMASGNEITAVPAVLGHILPSLKVLDLENNSVTTVAGEIGDCIKLKTLLLKGNPLDDRRLMKIVDNQTPPFSKPVIDFVRANGPRQAVANSDGKTDSKKKKKKAKKTKENDYVINEPDKFIRVLRYDDTVPVVTVTEAVSDVRPYIVCCVLKQVDLQKEGNFKGFIALQTKLHDNICKKRTAATIATHDLAKICGKNLVFDAQPPDTFKIAALSRDGQVAALSALELLSQLQKQAEALRKEKKRNTYSGIHKFLYLLEGKRLCPLLKDEEGQVISFPPITNSDNTKISPETMDVYVEVTSSTSLGTCKQVLDSLLHQVATLLDVCQEESGERSCRLVVQQAKVVTSEGQLKVLYPAQPDLFFDDLGVVREQV